MKIFVYLIVFCADIDNYTNAFILLKDGDILKEVMFEDSPCSFSIVEKMIERSMNITGKWIESNPRFVGVLDEQHMVDIDNKRYISIVYATHMNAKNTLNPPYVWEPIAKLEEVCSNIISKNIIRYAGTSI